MYGPLQKKNSDSVVALTTTLEEAENDRYLPEKRIRFEKERNVFKNKHSNLNM